MKRLLAGLAVGWIAVTSALAQSNTPVGLWKTIDDETKKERILVRIVDTNGVLSGRIEKYLDPTIAADTKCDKCSDDRKDQPVLGMQILRDLKKSADTEGRWDGGTVVDPHNGKVYKARVTPIEGGQKLEMRGYLGISLIGRTQTWIRVE